MGDVIPFPRTRPTLSIEALANQLETAHAALPALLSNMGSAGRSAMALCQSFQVSLQRMNASFDEALELNAAHQRLQRDTQAAIDVADHDPEAAATLLAQLRDDYARLRKPLP